MNEYRNRQYSQTSIYRASLYREHGYIAAPLGPRKKLRKKMNFFFLVLILAKSYQYVRYTASAVTTYDIF